MSGETLDGLEVLTSPAPEPDPLRFGAVVTFSTGSILHRRHVEHLGSFRKEWRRAGSMRWAHPGEQLEGIIIGRRTLADGRNVYHGDDGGVEFIADRHFTAYLVAYAMHRSPVYVLAEDLA